jgi:hypothetical protein
MKVRVKLLNLALRRKANAVSVILDIRIAVNHRDHLSGDD